MSETEVVLPYAQGLAGESKESGKEKSLAEARAKFDEVLRKQRDAASDVEPKEKPEKKPKAAKAEKPAAPPAAPEKPKGVHDEERLRAKLLLAGHPKKAIESLSGEDLREWWKNVEERESAQAKALERASVAEKKLKALAETAGDEEPQRGVPASDPDLEEIARELADQFGEDEAGVFLKALHKLTEPLHAKVNSMEGIIRAAQTKGIKGISTSNRERLSQEWPHLATNDRAWDTVHKEVLAAFEADPTRYSSPEAAYDDVVSGLYGGIETAATNGNGQHESSEADEETETLKARISASAPSHSERKGRPKPATPLQAARAAFDHVREEPEDTIGAARAYRRAIKTS
jgi:hypothetical protein